MKISSNRTVLACFFTVAALVFLSSCLPEAAENPSVLRIGVQVNDIDSTLTAGSDSLLVNRVRLIHGNSFLRVSEDSTVQLTFPSQLTLTPDLNGSTELIINSPFPEGAYQALTFIIVRAGAVPDTVPRYNPDAVFTDGGSYSIVVNGTFNGEDFTLKISETFKYNFNFITPVTVESESKLYAFLVSSNAESWFINDEGLGFLDPTDGKNKDAISANIAQFFTIEQLSPEE